MQILRIQSQVTNRAEIIVKNIATSVVWAKTGIWVIITGKPNTRISGCIWSLMFIRRKNEGD